MNSTGIARIERLDAIDGRGNRGWGWHRASDPAAAAPGWRDARWTEWTRLAGAQRAEGGGLVVSRLAQGAFVASLEPERIVVAGPLDASVAEAISLRGQAVWSDPDDLRRIEDAVAGVPPLAPALAPQLEALLTVLWQVQARPSVLVVDLRSASPWVEAFRVVAELMGLTSVAVGAGRVLDDRSVGAEVQLVAPDVAAVWSQSSGNYPLLRSDAPPTSTDDAVAMTSALIHAGSALVLRTTARQSGEWDGSWDGLKTWFSDRRARFGSVPMLARDQVPQDSLQAIAIAPEGRAWLVEDALGAGSAWVARVDPGRSFESLRTNNPAAFAALRDVSLQVWASLTTTVDRMALVERLGRHLASPAQLTGFIQETFDGAAEADLVEVARWAGDLGHGLDASSPQVHALLRSTDESELADLLRSLSNPLALATLVTADERWALPWFDQIDGAFEAAAATPQGADAIVALALTNPGFADDARSEAVAADPALQKQLGDAIGRRKLPSADVLALLIARVVRPFLGAEPSAQYLDLVARQRALPVLSLVPAARAQGLDWVPKDQVVLVALNEGKEDITGLLDLHPQVDALVDAVRKGMGTRWQAAWLDRADTIEALLETKVGAALLIDFAAADPSFLQGPRAQVCRTAFSTYGPTADLWSDVVLIRLGARVLSEGATIVSRTCVPVLPPDRLDGIVAAWLGSYQGEATDAELLALTDWLADHTPDAPVGNDLVRLARASGRSVATARVLVERGASIADLLPPGADVASIQAWIEGVDERDDVMADQLARYLGQRRELLHMLQPTPELLAAGRHHLSLGQILAPLVADPRQGMELAFGAHEAGRMTDRLVQPLIDAQETEVAGLRGQLGQAAASAQDAEARLSRTEAGLAAKEDELRATLDALAARDAQLAERNALISAQADELGARDLVISAQADELGARDLVISERDDQVAAYEQRVDDLRAQVGQQGAVIAERTAAQADAIAATSSPEAELPADVGADPGHRLAAHLDEVDASTTGQDGVGVAPDRSHRPPEPDDPLPTDPPATRASKGRVLGIVLAPIVAVIAVAIAAFAADSWTRALRGAGVAIALGAGTVSIGRLLLVTTSSRRGSSGGASPRVSWACVAGNLLGGALAVVAVGWSGLAWWATCLAALAALALTAGVELLVWRQATSSTETPAGPAPDGPVARQDGRGPRAADRWVLLGAWGLLVLVLAILALAGATDDGSPSSSGGEQAAPLETTTTARGTSTVLETTSTTEVRGTPAGRPKSVEVTWDGVTADQIPADIADRVRSAITQSGSDPDSVRPRVVLVNAAALGLDESEKLGEAIAFSLASNAYFKEAQIKPGIIKAGPGRVEIEVYFDE